MRSSLAGLGFAILGFAAPAHGALRPSFSFDDALWRATDVVVATEGDVIDGKLRVLEVWKGGLKPDTEVVVPQIARFADPETRRVHDFVRATDQVVTGRRVILFLVRPAAEAGKPPADKLAWEPASRPDEGFSTSVCWIEDGDVSSYVQIENPGPSQLTRLETSEVEMHARAASFRVLHAELERAAAAREPVRIAQVFRAFQRGSFHSAANASIDALAALGPPALPTLRELLQDRTLTHWHPRLIKSIGDIGGGESIAILAGVVEDEHKFWSERLPGLPGNWWNADPADSRQELRTHYSRMLTAVQGLKTESSETARERVAALRRLWASRPELTNMRSQVIQACDEVVPPVGEGD